MSVQQSDPDEDIRCTNCLTPKSCRTWGCHVSPLERIEKCAKRDVAQICRTWPQARLDAQARGYGTGRTFDGTNRGQSELTSVEAAAARPDFATGWIAELGDVLLKLGCKPTVQETDEQIILAKVEFVCMTWPDGADATLKRLHYLAESARLWWPDPSPSGTKVEGVTIGERGNDVQLCGLCRQPVTGGYNDPIRTWGIDSTPYHAKSCWFTVSRGHTLNRITPGQDSVA